MSEALKFDNSVIIHGHPVVQLKSRWGITDHNPRSIIVMWLNSDKLIPYVNREDKIDMKSIFEKIWLEHKV